MPDEELVSLSDVLVVDDHPLFCDALSMTLKSINGVASVTAVSTLEDALAQFPSENTADVILLDLNLPDVTGLDGLVRLKTKAGDVPILVVSSMADNRVISSVMRSGANGFVPKHSQRDTLIRAFRTIAMGERYLPDDFQEVPESEPSEHDSDMVVKRLATLTKQQMRILQLICAGKLNKQIAFDLSIAETTVKAHVTAIMRKLGVQSRTQAVLLAGKASFSSILPDDAEA